MGVCVFLIPSLFPRRCISQVRVRVTQYSIRLDLWPSVACIWLKLHSLLCYILAGKHAPEQRVRGVLCKSACVGQLYAHCFVIPGQVGQPFYVVSRPATPRFTRSGNEALTTVSYPFMDDGRSVSCGYLGEGLVPDAPPHFPTQAYNPVA